MPLTDECGPHCGIANGHEGHCDTCHIIIESSRQTLDMHAYPERYLDHTSDGA